MKDKNKIIDMKKILFFIFLFVSNCYYSIAQEDKKEYYNFNDSKYTFIGIQLLGSGAMYTFFFEKVYIQQQKYLLILNLSLNMYGVITRIAFPSILYPF